ncbi:MAG TPA: argininosuccinate lyase [Limnochordia bacterium]
MKPWGGRFSKPTDAAVESFHASIGFDWRLFPYELRASRAHARALARCGVLTSEEAERICRGLDAIEADFAAGRIEWDASVEDIHMLVEAELTRREGELGKKLHTGRSRNDQVATDTRLFVKEAIEGLDADLRAMQRTLLSLADRHAGVAMPGYTHLQRAQPVLLAHHWLAYVEMFQRDRERLRDAYRRTDVCPLGSGALAGVTYPIDREWVAQALGFGSISANSLDAVSDRDYVIELIGALALVMMHLSRLAEEIVLWTSAEFGFIELDDAFSTGSSIMPQKKNPDVAELTRGKAARVFGHLSATLSMMKGLPLAYNKDMQEDKEALFDAVDTTRACLKVWAPMLEGISIRPERMAAALRHGFVAATDLTDYLVKKGIPFREAHRIVGELVRRAAARGQDLAELPLCELQAVSPALDEEARSVLTIERCLAARDLPGGTAPRRVAEALAAARRRVEGFCVTGAS